MELKLHVASGLYAGKADRVLARLRRLVRIEAGLDPDSASNRADADRELDRALTELRLVLALIDVLRRGEDPELWLTDLSVYFESEGRS